MAKIIGLENSTIEDVNRELAKGGKFVVFPYCFSIVIMSFRRSSEIYFVRAGENTLIKSMKYTLISFCFGWWGIPWGIIWTIQSICTNLAGGRNITEQVMSALRQE